MGKTSYDFLSSVYNLPSNCTINQYGTLDSNSEDGIMHETLVDMENDFKKSNPIDLDQSIEHMKWKRSGALKFDEIKIKEKIVFNPHTNEIIGFEDGVFNIDVITTELAAILSNNTAPSLKGEKNRQKPTVAKYILVFMFIPWDHDSNPMKIVVARFSVGSSTSEELCNKIRFVIRALSFREFIVNQVTCDGATENVSVMRQLAISKHLMLSLI